MWRQCGRPSPGGHQAGPDGVDDAGRGDADGDGTGPTIVDEDVLGRRWRARGGCPVLPPVLPGEAEGGADGGGAAARGSCEPEPPAVSATVPPMTRTTSVRPAVTIRTIPRENGSSSSRASTAARRADRRPWRRGPASSPAAGMAAGAAAGVAATARLSGGSPA